MKKFQFALSWVKCHFEAVRPRNLSLDEISRCARNDDNYVRNDGNYLRYLFLSLLILAFALGAWNLSAYALGTEKQATGMMNSHGENMELEFRLYDPGSESIVDYEKYGRFEGVGTDKYEYRITDRKGLAAALGEGIYPNNSVYKDPNYRLLATK